MYERMTFPPSSVSPSPCLTKWPPSVALHQTRWTLNACGGPNEMTTPRNVLPACGGPSEKETFGCTGGADVDFAGDLGTSTSARPAAASASTMTTATNRFVFTSDEAYSACESTIRLITREKSGQPVGGPSRTLAQSSL